MESRRGIMQEKQTGKWGEWVKKETPKLSPRNLPPSSYEVIRLPTLTNSTTKGSQDQQQGAKRQKFTTSVASQPTEFGSKLEAINPSFIKPLVKTNVSGSFWMGLPQPFCKMHLPLVDTHFLLETENGVKYNVKYLAQRAAFSGGWRELAIIEKLSENDVLEFQLVNPTKFKVCKIKGNGSSEVNRTHVTPCSAPRVEQSDVVIPEKNNERSRTSSEVNRTHATPCSAPRVEQSDVVIPEKNNERSRTSSPVPGSQDEEHAVITSEEDDGIVQNVENVKKSPLESKSGNSMHPEFPSTVGGFNGITTFDDFVIMVDEFLKKDYELPHHVKWTYYQLCSSQNAVLHANLIKGINPVFIAGCLIETVDIANEMKISDLPTFVNKFEIWVQKLKSLELMGMNVSFLSARLLNLQKEACVSEVSKKRQQYTELCSEHAKSESIIKSLEDKLTELRRVSAKQADDMQKLETEIKEDDLRFQEQVSAPW